MKLFGIKFYNPFKPHIVVDGFGVYWVRKYELFSGGCIMTVVIIGIIGFTQITHSHSFQQKRD